MADDTFFELNGEGKIVEVSVNTGAVVNDSRTLPELVKNKWQFNTVTSDIICQKIADGKTLTRITAMDGFPSMGTVTRWRHEYPDFDGAIKIAESARAERYHDRIVESLEADAGLEKDEIQSAKLHFEKLKHLAKLGDRKRYGERDTKEENGGGNVTIVFDTGIRRDERTIPSEVVDIVNKQDKE